MGLIRRHSHQGQNKGPFWLTRLQLQEVIQIIIQALIGQAHGIDRAQRNILVSGFWITSPIAQGGCLGHKGPCSRVLNPFQLFLGHAPDPRRIHETVVKFKTSQNCFRRNHRLPPFFSFYYSIFFENYFQFRTLSIFP